MRLITVLVLLSCSYHLSAQDSIAIHFALGSAQLSTQAIKTIDSLLYNDVLSAKRKIGIVGYADIVGEEQGNMLLSKQRAKVVQQYLQKMYIDSNNIETVTGKGAIVRSPKTGGYPQDRKVVIVPGGFAEANKPEAKNKVFRIDINKIVVNGLVRLENLYFFAGTEIIKPESYPTLEMLYTAMYDNPALKIRIEGHVCCNSPDASGSNKIWVLDSNTHELTRVQAPDYKGENLSEKRARSVYEYLIKQGISTTRLSYMGFGSRHMIVNPEHNEADRDKNRRVEIRVLEK